MTLEKQFNNFLQNVQVQLCSLPFQKKKKKNLTYTVINFYVHSCKNVQ